MRHRVEMEKHGDRSLFSSLRLLLNTLSRFAIIELPIALAVLPSHGATTNLLPVADTSLMESSPTNNLGGETFLLVGTGENLKRHRALLKFDLASQIPLGSVIKSAKLKVELAWLPGNGYAVSGVGLHRVLRPWGEGSKESPTNCNSCTGRGAPATVNEATWLYRLSGTTNTWSTPGGALADDYHPVASASATIYKFADSPYSFGSSAQMIADVQTWLDYPETNFGWMLLCQQESTPFTARRFSSREDLNFAPYLALEYVEPPHIEQVQRVGNQFQLQFTALPAQTYFVEFRDSISSGNWQTMATLPPQTESTRVLIVDLASSNQRFYRLGTQ